MIILFRKSQLALFDAPVHVAASVRKDGTVVKPHVRIQKIAMKPAAKPHQPSLFDELAPASRGQTLDLFANEPHPIMVEKKPEPAAVPTLDDVLARYGGRDGVRQIILTAPMKEASKVLGLLSQLSGKTLDQVTEEYGSKPEPVAEPAPAVETKPVKAKRPRKAKVAPVTPASDPEPANLTKLASSDTSAPFGVPAGTSKGKRREINAAVIAALETDSPDPKLLRQYSGNGGCGDSLNEFYTDPDVARAMWAALGTLGATHGTALEPSCATGVFLHTAPAGFRITGVELDPVSAKVAQVLHGARHEIVTGALERFATTDDRQFDVVIGNPPYGPRGFLAKDDKVGLTTCEQYFTDTALDKCKPGGLVALVVPTGIMDGKNTRSLRAEMLRKGEFLGAMRMPNTAFEHSHTEVTTDVVFLRKRPDDVAGALGTLDDEQRRALGVWDEEFLAGSYFTGRGAHNVLGTMTEGRHGPRHHRRGFDGRRGRRDRRVPAGCGERRGGRSDRTADPRRAAGRGCA
jgi:hypothetical protein